MTEKTKNDKPSETNPIGSVIKWVGSASLISIILLVVAFQNFWKNTTHIADRESERQEQRDSEVAAAAVAINRARLTQERADFAAEFAECWPTATCDGITQLPIDDNQNEAIESIIDELRIIQDKFAEHCSKHRDAGQKWQDCWK